MQVLIFHIGAERFGLPTAVIERVLPLLNLVAIPGAPTFVAGLMDYHGQVVPVVDLGAIGGGAPAPAQLDTRILLVDYLSPAGSRHALGLIAAGVRGTTRLTGVVDSGVMLAHAPHLGQVVNSPEGLVQLVDLAQLLPAEVRLLLFQAAA